MGEGGLIRRGKDVGEKEVKELIMAVGTSQVEHRVSISGEIVDGDVGVGEEIEAKVRLVVDGCPVKGVPSHVITFDLGDRTRGLPPGHTLDQELGTCVAAVHHSTQQGTQAIVVDRVEIRTPAGKEESNSVSVPTRSSRVKH